MRPSSRFPIMDRGLPEIDDVELGLDALWWDLDALRDGWPKARKAITSRTGEEGRIDALPDALLTLLEHAANVALASDPEPYIAAMREWLSEGQRDAVLARRQQQGPPPSALNRLIDRWLGRLPNG